MEDTTIIFPFEALPRELQGEALRFASDLDRFLFSLVNRTQRSRYPFGLAPTWTSSSLFEADDDIDRDDSVIAKSGPEDTFRGERFAVACAELGLVEPLKLIHPSRLGKGTQVSAALGGHQAVLEYLISVGHDLLWSLANPAARRGHLVLLRWLDTKGLRFTNQTMRAACRGGQFEIIKWLHSAPNHVRWHIYSIVDVAQYGDVEIVKWMLEHGCPPYPRKALSRAAKSGHLALVQFLYTDLDDAGYLSTISHAAAENGHLHIIKWLVSIGHKFDTAVLRTAASRGDITIAEIVLESGTPWPGDLLFFAVYGEQIDFMRWAIRRGLEDFLNFRIVPKSLLLFATARAGSVKLVRFCLEECKLEVSPPIFEAILRSYTPGMSREKDSEQRLELLKYLHNRGVPFIADAVKFAVSTNRPSVFQWLVESGCPYSVEDVAHEALRLNYPGFYRWALERGAKVEEAAFGMAAREGDVELLEDLTKTLGPAPSDAYFKAINGNSVKALSFLVKEKIKVPDDFLRYCLVRCEKELIQLVLTLDVPLKPVHYTEAALQENTEYLDLLFERHCPISPEAPSAFEVSPVDASANPNGKLDTFEIAAAELLDICDVISFHLSLRRIFAGKSLDMVKWFASKGFSLIAKSKIAIYVSEVKARSKYIHLRWPEQFLEPAVNSKLVKTLMGQVADVISKLPDIDRYWFEDDLDETLPDTIEDCRHMHPLALLFDVGREFVCLSCRSEGLGYAYRCRECDSIAVHIGCALVISNLSFKHLDKSVHAHELVATHDPYRQRSFQCDLCHQEFQKPFWSHHCAECQFDAHPQCLSEASTSTSTIGSENQEASDILQGSSPGTRNFLIASLFLMFVTFVIAGSPLPRDQDLDHARFTVDDNSAKLEAYLRLANQQNRTSEEPSVAPNRALDLCFC